MSRAWPIVPLEEIFAIARGGSPRPIDQFLTDDPDGMNWVMISDATESGKFINSTKKRIRREGVKSSRVVKPGDFLLTNSMSFGRPYIMNTSGCIHDGWLVLSPRSNSVSADFFYHLLGSDFVYSEFSRRAAGATVKNLNIDLVKAVQVPIPPLPEQRRIAAILDKVDGLRRKREEVLHKVDDLSRAVFHDLTSSHGTASGRRSAVRLMDVLKSPLRNGLSPSNNGVYPGRVLTLSAITGTAFNEACVKRALFTQSPPNNQTVNESDLLICRGNGNRTLVGRGYFPTHTDRGVLFPDTMIAACIDTDRIERLFLEYTWNSPSVRRQIESLARTTNGTYKVNQAMLENVTFIAPPMEYQQEFGRRISTLRAVRAKYYSGRVLLDSLFVSLRHRAFRGEL